MEGSIAIIISGEKLNLNELREKIQLSPNRIIERGQLLSLKKTARVNIWIYENKFKENNIEEIIGIFLKSIVPFREYIVKYSKICDADLNICINSKYGQFGFSLSNDYISVIQSLGLNMNFHMLSFGMVEDE